MRKGYVYGITNIITGQWYVGKSINIRGLKQRWTSHKRDLIKNRHCNKYLQRSWNKYGEKSFMFVELYNVEKEYDELKTFIIEKEVFFTKKMNAHIRDNGFNMMYGAGEYKEVSSTTRRKISKSQKGIPRPCISGENHPMYGKPSAFAGRNHSEDAKRKISDSNKGKVLSEETRALISKTRKERDIKYPEGYDNKLSKPIVQLDKEYKFINKYPSLRYASESSGAQVSHINKVCNKKRKTAGGYIWMYEYEYEGELLWVKEKEV